MCLGVSICTSSLSAYSCLCMYVVVCSHVFQGCGCSIFIIRVYLVVLSLWEVLSSVCVC